MPSSKLTYDLPSAPTSHFVKEEHIEYGFVGKRIDPSFCNSMLNTPLYQARSDQDPQERADAAALPLPARG